MVKKITFSYCFIGIAVGIIFSEYETDINHDSNKGKFTVPFGDAYNYSDIFVKRAVDGDTLVLEKGERFRLIGIDTPEMRESKKLYRDSQRSKQSVQMPARSRSFDGTRL